MIGATLHLHRVASDICFWCNGRDGRHDRRCLIAHLENAQKKTDETAKDATETRPATTLSSTPQ